jgi:hypothetical protein
MTRHLLGKAAAAAAAFLAAPALAAAQDEHAGHGAAPAPEVAAEPADPHVGHAGHGAGHEGHAMDHGVMGMDQGAAHEGHDMSSMTGAFGSYGMAREASGTAWQPDNSTHDGVHATRGDWDLMGHVMLDAVYDWQDGPRGDEKTFLAGMAMGSARRTLGETNTLQLRAMLSPDPFMGKSGYPLLLAAGETADGVTPLVDRQHPHDLFMELSASLSRQLTDEASVFVYAGLPGEPAFGPPAFMHRMSIMDSPEAPITHHWLDSTHITFGVVTAGVVLGDWKLEASRFRGREPDENRFDIETGELDSSAARISWNPSPAWSLQASWADATSPEQLEPDDDATKWSASAIYAKPLSLGALGDGLWSTTLAWGRRVAEHDDLDAVALESALKSGPWTLFARAERVETNELELTGGHHGPTHAVGKASLGAVRDFPIRNRVSIGLGGLYSFNIVPEALEPSYGGDPGGAMAFVRLKIG